MMAMEYEVMMDQNHLNMKMFMSSRFNGKLTQQWKHLAQSNPFNKAGQ